MLTIILTSQNKSSTKYIDFKAIIPPQAVGQYSFLNFDLILEARVLYKLQYSFSIPLLFILEVRVLYKLQYFCRQNFTPTFIFNCHSLVWLSPSHTHTHTHTHNTTKWVDLMQLALNHLHIVGRVLGVEEEMQSWWMGQQQHFLL